YAGRFDKALSTLASKEKRAQSSLNHAGTRAGQASATGQLSSAYSAAARSLAKLNLSPADVSLNAQLVAALRATGNAYGKAVTQANHKDRGGYAQKGRAAVQAHGGVNAAITGLKNAGYSVPGSLRSHFAHAVTLPTLKQDPVATPVPTAAPTVTPCTT